MRRFVATSLAGLLAFGAVVLAQSSPANAPPQRTGGTEANAGAKGPSQPATPTAPAPPLGDRFGWNPRERTAKGISALEKGDAPAAKDALDTALRLKPNDPTARYNAGTGRLAAGDPSAGVLLDLAAREAPPELAPAAWYNLGEAKLGARDFQGAAQAFVETLKREPTHANAKHNLELALRELEKQKQEQQRQQQNQQQKQPKDDSQNDPNDPQNQQKDPDQKDPNDPKEQNQQQNQGDSKDQQPNDPSQDGNDPSDPNDPNGPNDPSSTGPQGQPKDRPGPLPQFHDLPDMNADQAAAILRAVENLERQQRRERAAKAAKAASTTVEIDW